MKKHFMLENKMTKIAIFDVCDTLYSVNTTFKFLDKIFLIIKNIYFIEKYQKYF